MAPTLDRAGASPDTPLAAWVRALEKVAPLQSVAGPTITARITERAQYAPDAPALLSARETLTYGALARRAARYAGWALEQDLQPGDVVCLLMPNRPEYAAIWLGIVDTGGVVALLNTGLVGATLIHAIGVARPRHVIVDASLEGALAAIAAQLSPAPQIWVHGPGRRWPSIDAYVDRPGRAAVIPAERRPRLADPALLIYTSGTTGLPKAAKVSHRRVMEWSAWFEGMLDAAPDDRMYNCLPMFHSVGGVVAVGAMLLAGGSVLICERFSASAFWDDVGDGECTLFQYIGELCRYLLASPPHPRETAHRLRLCAGNGLRGDVWRAFQRRFQIPRILEFYAATEGNVSLYNCDGKPGAIGRIPPFLAHRFPVAIVRVDQATGAPVRGPDGRCIACDPGEAGEMLGRISGPGTESGRPFEGYADPEASERKLLRDVQAIGDLWFRTGDLMRRDPAGYFYFVDRLGDTFRWKGENVSAEQVAETIRGCPGINDAVVYGVAVPGTEGRAGMAAITASGVPDLAALRQALADALPAHAHPLFLRICNRIATTSTFKPLKADLARDGYDPAQLTDPLFFNDHAAETFIPLDRPLHERIVSGQLRL